MRNKIDSFLSEKLIIKENLEEALLKFPNNIVFKEYKEEFERLFQKDKNVMEEEENKKPDITIGEETQEFLMSESLVIEQQQKEQQIVESSTMILTDSQFWEDPQTHGEVVDMVFKTVDKMKSKSLAIQFEAEEMSEGGKEEEKVKEQKEKEKEEKEKEEKEKEAKEVEKKIVEEEPTNQTEEIISESKIAASYLDDAPSFSLGFTPEEEKEEKEKTQMKEEQ